LVGPSSQQKKAATCFASSTFRAFAMSHSKSLFILGLLMLNVGCHSAHSPAQSLSEKLASVLPEEGTEQTQSLLMLAQAGAPKAKLLKFVSDLKDEIKPWPAEAHATLKERIDAVNACATTKDGEMAHNLAQKRQCDEQSDLHKKCRKEESKKFKNKTHWEAVRAEKKGIMDRECKIFRDVKEEVRAAKASHGGGNVESFLESVCGRFGILITRYEDAKEKCTTATAEHERVSAIYEKVASEYEVQRNACDDKQTETEVVCCHYALATKDTCDSYGTCFEDKVAEYRQVKGLVEKQEKVKKVEWRVWSRIECLLPALDTDNSAKIAECKAIKEHNTDHLTITYPDEPAKDSCTIEAAYPGTDAYYKAHMASLPDDAKGRPVAQCVGLTGTQACTAKIDVVLALDESYSMKYSMERFKGVATQIIDEFALGPGGVRMAVVGFDTDAILHESWSYHAYEIKAGIDKLQHGGATSISSSIEMAVDEFSTSRAGAGKVIILISDGEQTTAGGPPAAVAAANQAKASGIVIYAWGFGHVTEETLKKIASDPNQALFKPTVNELEVHVHDLQAAVCAEKAP